MVTNTTYPNHLQPPSPQGDTILLVIYFLNLIVGLPGNLLLIRYILHFKREGALKWGPGAGLWGHGAQGARQYESLRHCVDESKSI